MKFVDVHCHLDEEYFSDVKSLFKRLKRAGVEKVIASGVDLKSSEFFANLSEKYPQCYFTAGFHPTELKTYGADKLNRIAELAKHEKCVAIGEAGLDYHYPDTDKALQEEAFEAQILLADGAGLPLVIHSRDAAADTLEILKNNISLLKRGFVLHCFSYSPEVAAEAEKMGGYFSFGGTSTYSGSNKAKRAIAAIGLDRILTETDSPYLAPASRKGQFPNTPESIPEILENVAIVRGISKEAAAEKVWANAHTLFEKLNFI